MCSADLDIQQSNRSIATRRPRPRPSISPFLLRASIANLRRRRGRHPACDDRYATTAASSTALVVLWRTRSRHDRANLGLTGGCIRRLSRSVRALFPSGVGAVDTSVKRSRKSLRCADTRATQNDAGKLPRLLTGRPQYFQSGDQQVTTGRPRPSSSRAGS